MEKYIILIQCLLKMGYYILIGTLVTLPILSLVTLFTNDTSWLKKIYDRMIK